MATELAQAIVRDGEGATKFITIAVEGGRDAAECRRVALAIAHSPLVKTAFFASDPNLGRIVCAIGNAAVGRSRSVARVVLRSTTCWSSTTARARASYTEEDGQRVMKKDEITVRVTLGRGACDGDRLDVRFFARLRQHQRRLPQLGCTQLLGERSYSMANAADTRRALLRASKAFSSASKACLPPPPPPTDWNAHAFRWRKRAGRGYLEAVLHPHAIRLDDLVAIDEQKRAIDANTRQFVAGLPANNVLLTGSRGTGKSSLVKAMLVKYAAKGLRLIEVDKSDLVDLPDIAAEVAARRERFIVFCDDLTFDAGEPGYKALKVMLDGTIAAAGANMLIYATSNRRHLMPEYFSENLETKHIGGEVHPGESVEEKISLSERFGLWVSFYPFSQDDYLAAVASWLAAFGVAAPKIVARCGSAHPRSGAVRAAARLAQRPRRVAVRAELRRRRRTARKTQARAA